MSGRQQACSSVLRLAVVGQDHRERCSRDRSPYDPLIGGGRAVLQSARLNGTVGADAQQGRYLLRRGWLLRVRLLASGGRYY